MTLPVTLAPSRQVTEIDSVPFRDEPLWLNVTENVPEPAFELAVQVPFHLPSRAAVDPPPSDVGLETGDPVLEKLSVPVGAVELVELAAGAARAGCQEGPTQEECPAHPKGGRAVHPISFPRLWTDAHPTPEF